METATPAAEPSISDLRALLNTPAPETDATAAAPATPAAPAAGARTAPDSGTDSTEDATRDRGADGKFKAAAGDENAQGEPDNAQKRINKAVKAQREAERQRDEALARLATPGSQPAATQTAQTPAAAATPAKPQAEKFATYEEYLEALSDWKLDVRTAEWERQAAAKTAEAATAKLLEANAATFAERKALYPDWDEKVNGATDIAITKDMHEFIVESPYRADLGYYLAEHPDEAERIFGLSPKRQAAALGVIEASFEKAPAKTSETKTPAAKPLPRPPSKVGGGAAPSAIDLNDPKLDMRTFKREVQKQLATA